VFDKAIELNNQNLMAKYKKAITLVSIMEKQDASQREYTARAALLELEQLRELLPREALVHFQIGKIYKKLKQREAALHYFMIAYNLPHKDDPITKEEIDKLLNNEDDDEAANHMGAAQQQQFEDEDMQ